VNGDDYDDVIVGAPWETFGGRPAGVARVFYGSPGGLSDWIEWTAGGDRQGARFGYSVGTAGDVNNDGYDDVIVGAPPDSFDGRAFIFLGDDPYLSATASYTLSINWPGARFGFSVGAAGDVDGDDYDDVIVGAPFYDNGESSEGMFALFYGAGLTMTMPLSQTLEGGQNEAQMGYSVGTAGDVNGDTYDDVVVGAPGYESGAVEVGALYLFYGSGSGLVMTPTVIAGGQADARFGTAVGTAGDVNNDGFDDVIVGAPRHDHGEEDEGAAFVFLGSDLGLSATPVWTAEIDLPGALFGSSVGTAGDVNDDGYDEVIVGAPTYDDGSHKDEGAAFVFQGFPGGLITSARWRGEGNKQETRYGASVSTAGDVDGDGYADIIVGAPEYFIQTDPLGRAFAYVGSGLAPHQVFLPLIQMDFP
jgi:flavodoxin